MVMSNPTAALPNEAKLAAQSAVDTAAFAAIYDHYFSRVYTYIRYRVQHAEATDDLTAQVFERALVNVERYRPEQAPFAAWLFGIARNAVNDYLRVQKRRQWLSLEAISTWISGEPQPTEVVVQAEMRDQLLAAVARLGQREQDLLGLKFAGGLTNRRIAQLTGLSESNVGVVLYRAVRRLRRELQQEGLEG